MMMNCYENIAIPDFDIFKQFKILTLVIRLLSFSPSLSSNSSSFSSFSESELSLEEDEPESDSAGMGVSSGLELISYHRLRARK